MRIQGFLFACFIGATSAASLRLSQSVKVSAAKSILDYLRVIEGVTQDNLTTASENYQKIVIKSQAVHDSFSTKISAKQTEIDTATADYNIKVAATQYAESLNAGLDIKLKEAEQATEDAKKAYAEAVKDGEEAVSQAKYDFDKEQENYDHQFAMINKIRDLLDIDEEVEEEVRFFTLL